VGVTDCAKLGYTFLIFFLEKGSITPDQEIGPPNFDNVVAPLIWRRGDGAIAPPAQKKSQKNIFERE